MSRARAVTVEVSGPVNKEEAAVSGVEGSGKLLGECGYCGKAILHQERLLPLECLQCRNLYHVRCLRGIKPPVFLGDNLYKFTCAFCGNLGRESWERPNLQWVHVTHLALYNLILNGRGGRRGYFRWNEDICGFIRSNWSALMPHRKKTQSWHSTVAGTLSVHCPSVFQSGTSLFGEHGWWSLNTMQPPSLKSALGSCLGKRSSSSSAPGPTPSSQLSSPQEWLPPPAKKSKASSEHAKSRNSKTQHHQKHSPPPAIIEVVPPAPSHPPATPTLVQDAESALPSMMQLTEQQEKVVESYLSQCPLAVAKDPKSARLLRKLKVRSKQRLYNRQLFDLDAIICRSLSSTIKYVVDPSKEYSEQVSPVLRPIATQSAFNKTQTQLAVSARLATPSSPETQVLDQLSLIPILSRALPPEFRTFRQTLCGAGDVQTPITSPYTARKLPPFIFRSSELLPAKVKLNHSIHSRVAPGDICCVPQPESIDFCYLQEHHLPAVNNFVSHFFWPVDLSECLQYPDFTCVVLYGKLVVGCGFMTPDVKVNEAYISFLLVHPDFQRCSIGKIILYHLIQSCMGKDITLHVSVDNPAMLLYQTMGFKAERYCLDFYRHYYPEGHYLSKNAYFMRLRK